MADARVKYRWNITPAPPGEVAFLAAELKVSPLLARCLHNRGIRTVEAAADFLAPRLRQLSDPFLLPNLTLAVERLRLAHQQREPLVIFGDYDVDGISATALLVSFFAELGWQVHSYLPDRIAEGYGLTAESAANCVAKHPCSVLLAVDCGSTSVEPIAWLRQQGTEVLVLDHHQVSTPPPEPLALVNPQLLSRDPWGLRHLCSAGLAFKLAHGFLKQARAQGLPGADQVDLRRYLDLVALGTVADVVPLSGENRILVSRGLERICATARPGLQALTQVAQGGSRTSSWEVGYQLAPRLNAAGRMEHASDALELLLTQDATRAQSLARALDTRNRERQQVERAMAERIIKDLRGRFDQSRDTAIVEGDASWHIGVVGIVASRVVHEFHRPTLILGGDGEIWRGSGRSIEGFDLAAALGQCADLLVRHGGHAMAAGLAIRPERVDALRVRLAELAAAALTPDQLQPVLRLDAEVSLEEIQLDALRELERLHPLGQANPAVQVQLGRLTLARPPQPLGQTGQHVKLWVTDGRRQAEVVWWGGAGKPAPDGRFDLAAAPQINEFNGRTTVQLRLLDWQPAD